MILAGVLIPGLWRIFFAIGDGSRGVSQGLGAGARRIVFDDGGRVSEVVDRAVVEERILAATVRIVVESWTVRADEAGYEVEVKASHGTVKDGRYIVTHNHFSTAFSAEAGEGGYQVVRLLTVWGEEVYRGPASAFEVVWAGGETLVIGHGKDEFFSGLGFGSADFVEGTAVSLQPGMEVAQIDWDGSRTWVEWTTVEGVGVENGVPVMVLEGDIMVGASGGGVFLDGAHVANNWTVRQVLDTADVVVGSSTKVALNGEGWE